MWNGFSAYTMYMKTVKLAGALALLLLSCTVFSHLPTGMTQVTSEPPANPAPTLPTDTPEAHTGQPVPFELPDKVGGIAIHYYFDTAAYFSPEWLAEPISCSGKQFDLTEAPRVVKDIDQFVSAYHPEFIRQNLVDIYLLDDLQCFGSPYGGTNGWTSLYITVGPVNEGYTDPFLLSMLHAEFSSILMRNYSFPHEAWTSINDVGFTYSENDVKAVRQEDIRSQTEDLLQRGFLYLYSTTSEENDFNLFAEEFFTNAEKLCELRARYERINSKAELAIDFYESIGSGVEFQTCQQ